MYQYNTAKYYVAPCKNGAWFMTINAKTNEFNALLKELGCLVVYNGKKFANKDKFQVDQSLFVDLKESLYSYEVADNNYAHYFNGMYICTTAGTYNVRILDIHEPNIKQLINFMNDYVLKDDEKYDKPFFKSPIYKLHYIDGKPTDILIDIENEKVYDINDVSCETYMHANGLLFHGYWVMSVFCNSEITQAQTLKLMNGKNFNWHDFVMDN